MIEMSNIPVNTDSFPTLLKFNSSYPTVRIRVDGGGGGMVTYGYLDIATSFDWSSNIQSYYSETITTINESIVFESVKNYAEIDCIAFHKFTTIPTPIRGVSSNLPKSKLFV